MKKILLSVLILITSQLDISAQQCLDVDYKVRATYMAGSNIKDTLALGGFYVHKNVPQSITTTVNKLTNKNGLQIIIVDNKKITIDKNVSGFTVYIINKSNEIYQLPAQDSMIRLKRQVFYNQKWQDIEYIPSSWCGNSYHNVFIAPQKYWTLEAPCITGSIAAKVRFSLELNNNNIIFSKEFDGSFNLSQLTVEEGHHPKNIMDPYKN